jgi:6-phosphogluconolactonase (cycloisomerase 2 family)
MMKLKILTMFATFGVLFTVGCGDSTNPVSTAPVTTGGESRAAVERFAYTANFTEGTVSAFQVNPSTGELTETAGSPFAAGLETNYVQPTRDGRFLYAANFGSDNVVVYSINQTTGALTQLDAVPAGDGPRELSLDPSGGFLYAVNQNDDTISAWLVDTADGRLTELAGSPYATGDEPFGKAFTLDGRNLYVTPRIDNAIQRFSRDPATGELTAAETTPTGELPKGLEISPDGRFLYAVNRGSNTVSIFSINTETGLLTDTGLTPSTGDGPWGVEITPGGDYCYVNPESGALTELSGSPYVDGNQAKRMHIDATGSFLYAANGSDQPVSVYRIDPQTGALTQVASPPVATDAYDVNLAP